MGISVHSLAVAIRAFLASMQPSSSLVGVAEGAHAFALQLCA